VKKEFQIKFFNVAQYNRLLVLAYSTQFAKVELNENGKRRQMREDNNSTYGEIVHHNVFLIDSNVFQNGDANS
jgi:hypothetical protein